MAVSLARVKGSTAANMLLELFVVDPASEPEAYRMVDADADAVSFVVRRTTGSGALPVSIVASTPAVRVGTGHYVAVWEPLVTAEIARYEVIWTWEVNEVEYTQTTETEVLAADCQACRMYALVHDMRDEGFTAALLALYTDRFLQGRLLRASAQIDRWTGRSFVPRAKTLKLDGTGARALLLWEPIIAIAEVTMASSIFNPADLDVSESYRVYNRHLTQGLVTPDDRENPKLEFAEIDPSEFTTLGMTADFMIWPRGQQNVSITGVFGYTDGPGLPGITPYLIFRACMLLAIRDLSALSATSARAAALAAGRITKERTRDQEVQYAAGSGALAVGHFSGDPEIDNIIGNYVRPPMLGSA